MLVPTDSICDALTGELFLRYAVRDVTVPAQGTIKTGLYRDHVCSAASAVIGDFEFKKLR